MKKFLPAFVFALSAPAFSAIPTGAFLLKSKGGISCINSTFNPNFNQTVITGLDIPYYCNNNLLFDSKTGNAKDSNTFSCASVEEAFSAAPYGKYTTKSITLSGITVVNLDEVSSSNGNIPIVDAIVNVAFKSTFTFKADTKGICSQNSAAARTARYNADTNKEVAGSNQNPYALIRSLESKLNP